MRPLLPFLCTCMKRRSCSSCVSQKRDFNIYFLSLGCAIEGYSPGSFRLDLVSLEPSFVLWLMCCKVPARGSKVFFVPCASVPSMLPPMAGPHKDLKGKDHKTPMLAGAAPHTSPHSPVLSRITWIRSQAFQGNVNLVVTFTTIPNATKLQVRTSVQAPQGQPPPYEVSLTSQLSKQKQTRRLTAVTVFHTAPRRSICGCPPLPHKRQPPPQHHPSTNGEDADGPRQNQPTSTNNNRLPTNNQPLQQPPTPPVSK